MKAIKENGGGGLGYCSSGRCQDASNCMLKFNKKAQLTQREARDSLGI